MKIKIFVGIALFLIATGLFVSCKPTFGPDQIRKEQLEKPSNGND